MISKLLYKEALVLIGLIKWFTILDKQATTDEIVFIESIADEFGEKEYRAFFIAVDQMFQTEDELKDYVSKVEREEVREYIYELMLNLAETETINTHEADQLQWLAETWDISDR
ncbi:MAG: hypothetical protein ACMUJM_14245 [bacterium]